MKGIYSCCVIALCSFVAVSCGEKKKSNDIITTKPVVQAPSAPTKMQGYERTETVDWDGADFKVTVKRVVDEGAEQFTDDNGDKCYENKVVLTVLRSDGTEFFNREFTKTSFASCVDNGYLSKSTVLGIAFDRTEGGNMFFVASVGCPDQLSDDFIPIKLILSKSGTLTMEKGQDIDTTNNPNSDADEEEGV